MAEGVETEEQYLTLKAMGCDLVQGYYFSHPVPASEFERFLLERGQRGAALTEEPGKSRFDISTALTGDFESIFYVDVLTDFYMEFYSTPGGGLQIRPGGADFFTGAEEKLLRGVCAEDADRLRAPLCVTRTGGALSLPIFSSVQLPCVFHSCFSRIVAISRLFALLRSCIWGFTPWPWGNRKDFCCFFVERSML